MTPRSAEKRTPKPVPAKKENPFQYGWRDVRQVGPDGREEWIEVPLTLEDVLHPQEGDYILENLLHTDERMYLCLVARSRVARLRHGVILSDQGVDWKVKGLRHVCPDVCVVENLRRELPPMTVILDVIAFGARVLAAIEIVSPTTRVNDVKKKFAIYHRVGVRQYVLVDQETEGGPREVIGYRWTRSRYVRMRPDANGRIPVKSLGISIGLEENRAWAYELATGERIPDTPELAQRLETAVAEVGELKQRNDAVEARIRQLEDELRRLRGGNTN